MTLDIFKVAHVACGTLAHNFILLIWCGTVHHDTRCVPGRCVIETLTLISWPSYTHIAVLWTSRLLQLIIFHLLRDRDTTPASCPNTRKAFTFVRLTKLLWDRMSSSQEVAARCMNAAPSLAVLGFSAMLHVYTDEMKSSPVSKRIHFHFSSTCTFWDLQHNAVVVWPECIRTSTSDGGSIYTLVLLIFFIVLTTYSLKMRLLKDFADDFLTAA